MHVCTVAGQGYLAEVDVLARTLLAVHPDAVLHVLDPDGTWPGHRDPRVRTLTPPDLGVTSAALHRAALLLGPRRIRPWLRPLALAHLADLVGPVCWLDPGLRVVGRLDALPQRASRGGLAAQPRTPRPLPDDGRTPTPQDAAREGTLDPGLLAVDPTAAPDLPARLRGWADRVLAADDDAQWLDGQGLDTQGLDAQGPDAAAGRTADDPPLRVVSAWTVDAATRLERAGGTLLVDGTPAQVVDLRGFDPRRPWVLAPAHATGPSTGVPRALLSDHPVLAELCAQHADDLLSAAGDRPDDRTRHAPGDAVDGPGPLDRTADGVPVDDAVHRAYRAADTAWRRGTGPEPPAPHDPASGFADWLLGTDAPDVGPVGRYLAAVRDGRPDLQAAFPGKPTDHAEALLTWADTHGRHEAGVDPGLVDATLTRRGRTPSPRDRSGSAASGRPSRRPSRRAPRRPRTRGATSPGVDVVGYLNAELGVGESARLVLRALEAAGVPRRAVPVARHVQSRLVDGFADVTEGPAHDIALLCINADLVADAVAHLPPGVGAGYRIGMWYWEVETFPPALHAGFDAVDEVWVATDFVRDAIAPHTTLPVRTLTPPLPVPRPRPGATRAELGLPDGFVFLFAWDYLSTVERKNPLGLIEAFRRAFRPGEGPTLVLKSLNADRRVEDAERVRLRAAREPDVVLLEGSLDAADRDALVTLADCYVSLHRSEGLGLTMAEAMAVGTPVIATGYSGNLQFMDETTSFLVPWRPAAIPADAAPYPPGTRWADPDLDAAASLMRGVVADPAEAAARGARAAADLRERFSPEVTGRAMADRLSELAAQRPARRAPGPVPGRVLGALRRAGDRAARLRPPAAARRRSS